MKVALLLILTSSLVLGIPVPEFEKKGNLYNHCFMKKTSKLNCYMVSEALKYEIERFLPAENGAYYKVTESGMSESFQHFIGGTVQNGVWAQDFLIVLFEQGDLCYIDAKSQSKLPSFLGDSGMNFCNLAIPLGFWNFVNEELEDCPYALENSLNCF